MNKDLDSAKRIVVLSNVYDDQYLSIRGDSVSRCLSSPKRRDLFRCLELATNREIIVLSSPPRTENPSSFRWLPAQETKFSFYSQYFCSKWDVPKIRIPLSWFFYTRHVLKHTKNGDLLIIDNYELIYVISVLITRFFRNVTIILDYEDGKHLIDHGWQKTLSWLAESVGKRLIRGAILASPILKERLPKKLLSELFPGIIYNNKTFSININKETRFLYYGSLDETRGVGLLLDAIKMLPDYNWHLDIAGDGNLRTAVQEAVKSNSRITFHGALSSKDCDNLAETCHIGINPQRGSIAASNGTLPGKIFTYLSSSLVVLSSQASCVPEVCGSALLYYNEDTAVSLAAAMKAIIDAPEREMSKIDSCKTIEYFSFDQSVLRLRHFINEVLHN